MLTRQGVTAALPNTQKQTQGGCQNEETKKHGSNGKMDQNSRKRTKQNEYKQSSDAEFKSQVIRMLKELSEGLSNIKKTQSETKDTLIEIKNNSQGNNRRLDEGENQINDLEYKEAINNQSEQQEENQPPPNMRIV